MALLVSVSAVSASFSAPTKSFQGMVDLVNCLSMTCYVRLWSDATASPIVPGPANLALCNPRKSTVQRNKEPSSDEKLLNTACRWSQRFDVWTFVHQGSLSAVHFLAPYGSDS